jgi:vitamin-K-epoxide reductase (warfarin-sensitive)
MRYLLALIALAGIVVSVQALRIHNSNDTPPCSINEHWDCGVVNHSEFAVMHGVPVAEVGIFGYALLVILAFVGRPWLFLTASALGLAFAIRLSLIEANVLHTWCLYCVISQTIIALLAILGLVWTVLWMRSPRRAAMRRRS